MNVTSSKLLVGAFVEGLAQFAIEANGDGFGWS
jgi:hypothetical protein